MNHTGVLTRRVRACVRVRADTGVYGRVRARTDACGRVREYRRIHTATDYGKCVLALRAPDTYFHCVATHLSYLYNITRNYGIKVMMAGERAATVQSSTSATIFSMSWSISSLVGPRPAPEAAPDACEAGGADGSLNGSSRSSSPAGTGNLASSSCSFT